MSPLVYSFQSPDMMPGIFIFWMDMSRILAGLLAFYFSLAIAEPLPNVIVIYVDDLGYGDTGVYGHPVVQTPNIDKLAAGGLRYNNFHTTALCSPSRATLMA